MGKMTIQQILMQLAGGMGTSIQIFAVTLIFSLPLGLFVALGRMSKNKLLQAVIKVYISIMRGTPLMLQLLVVYFGPYYIFGMRVGNSYRLWAVFIGFVINYAAYFAEIYRSGIQSMPVGQYEAAKLLGYSKSQTFIKIILPQVIKRILPSVTNEVITLVKDTSLAFTLSVMEMFTTAKALASSQVSMMPFVAAGIFYYSFGLRLDAMVGSLCMSLSSVCVVTNALRLKRFKPYYQKENKKMKKEIVIEGMMCQHCKKHVEEALNGLADTTAAVDLENNLARVETVQDDSILKNAIEKAGYKAVGIKNV